MLLALFYLAISVISHAAVRGQENWNLKRDKEGITIHIRERAGSPLKEYKARAVVAHPIDRVFAFLSDLERHPEWVFRCKGLTIIEKVDDCRVRYHTAYGMPRPMKDRDLTAEMVITHHPGGNRIECLSYQIPLDYPLEDGVIRMPGYREWIILEKKDSLNTLYQVEGYVDPGGKVPPWLVNMFLVDGLYDAVVKTREILMDQTDDPEP